MERKTIRVEDIIDKINYLLQSEGPHVNDSYREGLCDIAETILHRTDNYRGYTYIEWKNGGCRRWEEAGKPEPADEYMYGKYGKFGRYYTPPLQNKNLNTLN
jgi:hypothetical protein